MAGFIAIGVGIFFLAACCFPRGQDALVWVGHRIIECLLFLALAMPWIILMYYAYTDQLSIPVRIVH